MSEPLTDTDRAVEVALVDLLSRVSPGATVCPSQAARAVSADEWRPLMDAARAAAQRLVDDGRAEVTQGGVVVDLATAKGPVRVRPVSPE